MSESFLDNWKKEYLAKEDNEFREAQAHELRIIDLFIAHRDELLVRISESKDLYQLSELKAEADRVMGEAERQANRF